jgi:hypothetical protein
MKLNKIFSMPPAAIQKSKEKAEAYAMEVLADELGQFVIEKKGEA